MVFYTSLILIVQTEFLLFNCQIEVGDNFSYLSQNNLQFNGGYLKLPIQFFCNNSETFKTLAFPKLEKEYKNNKFNLSVCSVVHITYFIIYNLSFRKSKYIKYLHNCIYSTEENQKRFYTRGTLKSIRIPRLAKIQSHYCDWLSSLK